MSAKLKVQLIAQTLLKGIPQSIQDTEFAERLADDEWVRDCKPGSSELVEFAGRACYQSWTMPNPKTATNEGYIAHIIDVNHGSVLEHANFTFYIEGVSRSLTHELVRHRHFSPSQLSQRYVDQSTLSYIIPPAFRGNEGIEFALNAFWDECVENYITLVDVMLESGAKRKEARQAARCVLPEMCETKLVLTGNARTFREFLQKRNHPAADEEIRELAQEIQKLLVEAEPNMFKDLLEKDDE